MAKIVNRAGMATATTGTGTVTLGAAIAGMLTFAEAGVANADAKIPYLITEGNDFEIGLGTYTSSGTTLSRDTVLASKIGGTAGTSKMNLAGAAQVRIVALAEHINTASKQMIPVSAGAMYPAATNGAQLSAYETAGGHSVPCLLFDTTTQEYAYFALMMPKGWNLGTLTYKVHWTNEFGLTTETVRWSLQAFAVRNDDALNGTLGTAVNVDDTWIAQNDLHVTDESGALTVGGTPSNECMVVFRISRVVASDNLTGDAILLGLKVYLNLDNANEL